MSSVQEQEQDLPSPHSVRSQTPLPGAHVNEHRGPDVHQAIRSVLALAPNLHAGYMVDVCLPTSGG